MCSLDLVKSTKRFLAEPFTKYRRKEISGESLMENNVFCSKKEKKSGKERAEKDQTMAMSFEANAQRRYHASERMSVIG